VEYTNRANTQTNDSQGLGQGAQGLGPGGPRVGRGEGCEVGGSQAPHQGQGNGGGVGPGQVLGGVPHNALVNGHEVSIGAVAVQDTRRPHSVPNLHPGDHKEGPSMDDKGVRA
jgi:hypothetical protein